MRLGLGYGIIERGMDLNIGENQRTGELCAMYFRTLFSFSIKRIHIFPTTFRCGS